MHIKSLIFNRLALILFVSLQFISAVHAASFKAPKPGDDIIGEPVWAFVEPGEALEDVGQRYDIGYYEMIEANPAVEPGVQLIPWSTVTIPAQFILPNVPHKGVVINLAELRLYYFPKGSKRVLTFPVGIGREGWATPMGTTTIVAKAKNPTWYPTEGVRADAASQGHHLPKVVPPGPDNPLGKYAMLLGWESYLIHSTNRPAGVGRRSSAGCIRMFPHDAAWFFKHVKMGTSVRVIDEPYKAGWSGHRLYLEAHQPLQESQEYYDMNMKPVVSVINKALKGKEPSINWHKARKIAHQQSGIPARIGSY